jgi:hypothetical protein
MSSSRVLNWHHLNVSNGHVVETEVSFEDSLGEVWLEDLRLQNRRGERKAKFPGANLSEDKLRSRRQPLPPGQVLQPSPHKYLRIHK